MATLDFTQPEEVVCFNIFLAPLLVVVFISFIYLEWFILDLIFVILELE